MKLQKLQQKKMRNVLTNNLRISNLQISNLQISNNNYTYIMDKIIKNILKHKVLILILFITVIFFTNKMNKRENFTINDIWTLFDNEESKPEEEEDTCSDE